MDQADPYGYGNPLWISNPGMADVSSSFFGLVHQRRPCRLWELGHRQNEKKENFHEFPHHPYRFFLLFCEPRLSCPYLLIPFHRVTYALPFIAL